MFTSCIYAQRFNKDFRRAEKLLEELWLKSIAPTADRTAGNKKRKALALTISPFNALLAVYSACDIGNKYSNETIIFSSRRQKILNDIDNLQLACYKQSNNLQLASYKQSDQLSPLRRVAE